MEEWQFPGKPALVVMHMQNGLAGSMTMMPTWSSDAAVAIRESGMVDRIQDLLAAFRDKQLPICFVNAHSTGSIGTAPEFGHIYKEFRSTRLEMDILHDETLRHDLDVMPEMNRQRGEGLLINWNLGAFTMSGLCPPTKERSAFFRISSSRMRATVLMFSYPIFGSISRAFIFITVIATVPILCVYPFFQKYFIKGMTIGSVKG